VCPTMTINLYECSSLVVASEIELSARSTDRKDLADVDVTVVMGEEVNPPYQRPSPDVVAELIVNNRVAYTICRVDGGYVARFPWVADIEIDAALQRVVCHPVPAGLETLIPIILPGTICAFLLSMRGTCVLHGSAVELGGRALSFVGASGQGKSTMAAVFCSAGASLVTDDVMPVDFGREGTDENAVLTRGIGFEIRLREQAAPLAESFGEGRTHLTGDLRHAVAPEMSLMQHIPLAAILLPRPDRVHPEVKAELLPASRASLILGQCQRIEGWREKDRLRRNFEDVSRIVEGVPVFEVQVPWGPPFQDDLAFEVLRACGLEDFSSILAQG
jgi:hypothetical protein